MRTLLKIAILAFAVVAVSPLSFASDKVATPAAAEAQNKDGETIAWLIALDNHEIAAGKIAKSKSKNREVLKYADMMVNQHSDHLKDTKTLSKKINVKAIDTDDVKSFEKQGKDAEADLKKKDKADFDDAYMSAMVSGHKDALKGVDDHLSTVSNNDLKSHLEKTKSVIEHHLTAAEQTQKDMKP